MEHLPDLLREQMGGSMADVAYRTLKRQVIDLTRAPGDTMREKAIATEMDISKTPVREALARLQHDGLVQPVPRWGYVVAPVTLGDAADLCDMRTILQAAAAASSAERGLGEAAVDRLRELSVDVDETDGVLGGPGLDDRLRRNYEFEAIIANGSGNARLADAVVRVLDEVERVVRLALLLDPSLPAGRLEQRRRIVDALATGDAEASREAMRDRSASAKDEMLSALRRSDAVGSVAILVPGGVSAARA